MVVIGLNKLFGTDGVRGVVNRDLTPQLALKLGQAIGTFFGEGSRILVGRDVRVGGYMVKSALIAGLLSTGVEVYDADYSPTPAIQYVTKLKGFDGAVIVTASHNPPEYNGIKVVDRDGVEIDRDKEREVEDIFFNEQFRIVSWYKLVKDAKPYPYVNDIYVQSIVEKVDREAIRKHGFKIVIDPANSVSALTSPRIARELGVKAITINGDLDPLFSSREPEPTPESLIETVKITSSIAAHLGVAHDGDGDRAIFIDDKGRVIWGDKMATILSKYLIERDGGALRKIYTAVSSSTIIEDYLRNYGVEVVWLKVGSVGIAREMMRNGDALCGFEENGGFMYPPHQYVRDGGMALALVLEMIAKWGRRLSDLYDELPKTYMVKTKLPLDRSKTQIVLENVSKAYSGYRQLTIDGIKVFGEDFWFLVRPSGTEPVIRIMVEAYERDKAKKIVDELIKIVRGV